MADNFDTDEEVLDALSTGVTAADPPPAGVRQSGLAAGEWNTSRAQLASEVDLGLVGMRSGSGPEALHVWRIGGHQVEVVVAPVLDDDVDHSATVTITPPVAAIEVHRPDNSPMSPAATANGVWEFEPGHRLFAIEFPTSTSERVRTPLIDCLDPM